MAIDISPDIPLGESRVHAKDIPPLDPSLYALSPEEAVFFKGATGINDDEALKAHIVMAQRKAYKIAPYPCIYGFRFLKMSITHNPVYNDVIKIGRERSGAILLDIGSCFGIDARKAAADGFPACNIVASDLRKEFLELSHVLFNTTKETYPGHFVAGDAFDPAILSVAPQSSCGESPLPRPDLETLTSLNPLRGYCSVINASSFFHLFSEEKQLHMARALAGLLSPEPGSLICGLHIGAREPGIFIDNKADQLSTIFCHSPESWAALWDGEVFEKGEVKVDATLRLYGQLGSEFYMLFWSVVRL